jgi:hypothetical protein
MGYRVAPRFRFLVFSYGERFEALRFPAWLRTKQRKASLSACRLQPVASLQLNLAPFHWPYGIGTTDFIGDW